MVQRAELYSHIKLGLSWWQVYFIARVRARLPLGSNQIGNLNTSYNLATICKDWKNNQQVTKYYISSRRKPGTQVESKPVLWLIEKTWSRIITINITNLAFHYTHFKQRRWWERTNAPTQECAFQDLYYPSIRTNTGALCISPSSTRLHTKADTAQGSTIHA
jgi:hypothetical protein